MPTRYHCACDRTFSKNSTAATTGYRLPDYGPENECFGCPFVLELYKGWGKDRKVSGYECRAQKLGPGIPEEEQISYQTGAWYDLSDTNTAHVYTLDRHWLLNFIQAYLDMDGATYTSLPEGERTPERLEQYYRNASLSLGRRVYVFGFAQNKRGLAAKKRLFQTFFDESGIAKDTLGPEGDPEGDKEKILEQIMIYKAIAQKKAKEDPPVVITYPTPSETTCPRYSGAKAKKGGGHIIQCGKDMLHIPDDGELTAKLKCCQGPEKESCRAYLVTWMKEHGHEEEITGWFTADIKKLYDNYQLAETQAAEITLAVQAEVIAPTEAAAVQEPSPQGRTIADVTAEIRFYKAQTVQSVIEIGKRLTEAKGMLEHGQWLNWLEESAEIKLRTAQRFMQLADTFPNASPVTHLSYTKLLALLAVPEEEREEFLEVTHNIGGEEKTVAEMSKRELEQVIRERDQYREIMHEYREAAQKYQEEMKDKGKELAQAQLDKRRLEQEIQALENRPVEVAVQSPSTEEIRRIREEAREEAFAEAEERYQPPSAWLEGVLADKSESYFTDAVQSAVYVLTATAAKKTGPVARRVLEKGIAFLREQAAELSKQCNLLMIHEPPRDLEDDFDFDPE